MITNKFSKVDITFKSFPIHCVHWVHISPWTRLFEFALIPSQFHIFFFFVQIKNCALSFHFVANWESTSSLSLTWFDKPKGASKKPKLWFWELILISWFWDWNKLKNLIYYWIFFLRANFFSLKTFNLKIQWTCYDLSKW